MTQVWAFKAFNYHEKIELRTFEVRPCFAGHSLALIFMYWMQRLCHQHKMELCINTPLGPSRQLIQKYFPGAVKGENSMYFLDTQNEMPIPSKIANLIEFEFDYETEQEEIRLRVDEFPTAAQLNDPQYIENHFNESNNRWRIPPSAPPHPGYRLRSRHT